MRNVSDKNCRENQHILCSIPFFRKFPRLWDNVEKMWWKQTDQRSKYGGKLHAGYVRLHARKHTPMSVCTHPRSRSHQRARAHTHTHTQIHNTYCVSTATDYMNAPEYHVIRASITNLFLLVLLNCAVKILPSSGLLRSVGWLNIDVSGQPIGPIFVVVPKRRRLTILRCVITQKTEEFGKPQRKAYDLALYQLYRIFKIE